MRKFEFIKPQTSVDFKEGDNYGRFVITPLERGYGITLGNALRRVLLSSMPGVAIVAIEIEGVEHEFMAIDGILEDVTGNHFESQERASENCGGSLFKAMPNENPALYELWIDAEGEKVVTAGDLHRAAN